MGSYAQKCRKRGIFKCHIYVWTLNIFEKIARKLATRSLTYNHCGFRGSRNSQRDPCVMCAVHGECSVNLNNNFKTLEARPPRLPSDGKAILKEYVRYTAAELEELAKQQRKKETEEKNKESKKKSLKPKTKKKKPKKKSKKSKTNKRRSKNRKKNRRNRRRSSSRRS